MSVLLVLVAVGPALAGLAALLVGPRRGALAARLATASTGLAFGAALAVAIAIGLDGPVSAVVERSDGRAVVGLYADRVGVALLLLVCGVSAVTQAFARRYLHGDVRAARFFAATGLLTAATAAMVTAATLVGLAVAWTVAGIALCVLLGMYGDLPAAREGVRRTARAFAFGDAALWLAVAIAVAAWGNLDLRRLPEQAPSLTTDGTTLAVVACLLVVAALARSAQLPLQGWLPATLAAPTPVSALLHAGVVNAGGVLLVRLSPLFGASALATHLAFFAGAATAVYGTALMLAKPDIKGALAHSTMGQMGFMIMTCGLGAFAAAIFHLVAHGMYKATLFLGSGAAVHRHVRHAKAPPVAGAEDRAPGVAVATFALGAPAAVLAAATALMHPETGGSGEGGLLLLFAWATLAWAGWGWLRCQRSMAGWVTVALAILIAAPAYVALLSAFTGFLAPALEGAGAETASPWLLLAVGGTLTLVTLIRLAGERTRLAELHKSLYVLALAGGHVVNARRSRRGRPRTGGWVTPRTLVPWSEGGRP